MLTAKSMSHGTTFSDSGLASDVDTWSKNEIPTISSVMEIRCCRVG